MMRILTAEPGSAPAEAPTGLRHGLPGVGVSTLAGQWYCELKVDLKYRHPEISVVSPALERGTAGHGAISAGAVPMTHAELEEQVLRGQEIYLQESRFSAPIYDATVIGIPDLIHLKGRDARLVLEFKFSKRADLFIDRFIQAQAYALLLEGSGYRTDRTVCVVGVLPSPEDREPSDSKMEHLKKGGVLPRILDRCAELSGRLDRSPRHVFSLRSTEETGTLHAFRFEPRTARLHLRWALDYWQGRREAVATTHASKCRVCPFNAARVCAKARTAPDPRLNVLPSILDGRPMLEVRWKETP